MSSEPPPIPPYWKEEKSVKSGRTYYFNIITGESIWERPVACFHYLSNWIKAKNKDGLTYYFNIKTQESSWEKPKVILDPKNEDNDISKSVENPTESYSSEDKMNRYGGHFRGNQHFQGPRSNPNHGNVGGNEHFQGPPSNPNHGNVSNQHKTWWPQSYNNTPNRRRWKNKNQGNWSDGNRNPNQFLLNNRRFMDFEDLQKSQRDTTQNDRFRRSSSVGREIPSMKRTPPVLGNSTQRLSFDGEKVNSPTRESPLMKRLASARGETIKPSSESNEIEHSGNSNTSIQQKRKQDNNETVASVSSGTSSTSIQQKRKLDDKTVPQKRPRIVLFDEDECETSSMNSSPTTSSPRSIREPVVIKTFTTPQPRDEQRRKYGNSRGRGWNQRPYDQYQQGGNNPNIKRGQSTRTPAQNRLLRIQSSLTSPRPSSPNRHHNTSQQTWRQNDSNFQRQNVSHTSPRNNVQNPESRQSDIRSEMGFSRPNSTWDSPRFKNAGPRSRSNSQSSDMSVDSGSSPRHRPVISTPVSASTQVQADQDTMEWEDIPTAVIVETVAEVRQSVTPSKAGFRIPSSSGHPPTRTTQNRSSLIVVLDTNVFLSSMEFVSRARDYMTREYAYPTLFIPWQVVQELDSLKDRSSGTRSLKQRAMAAIRFIETNLRSKHPRIVFQDQDSMERSQDFLRHECNDDRILSACLQLIPVLDQVGIKSMVLVSEDVNMRNKALINNLNSLSVLELEGVIFQGKPMRNIPTPSRPLSEEDIQLGDAFCSLKSKLFDVMSQILIDVLTRKMSPLPWEKGVFHKQPWDWKKLWSNYDKHWVSFEEEVAGYNVRYRLKGLKDIILNHERESRVTTEILRSFREEVSSFTRILKHPLIEDLIAEVHRVRQSGISSPSANHTSSAANHSHPSANHSRPSTNHSRPSANYTSPSSNYTSPSPNYTSPSPNYTSPSANYTSSAANHKRPSANYTIPSSNYTSPSPSHTSPSPNHTSPSPSPNQEARSRVNRSVYCESNPGPSTTESSITIKQESSGSKSAKPNESKLAAVFNKIERVFKSIEIFRVNVFRFLDLDPGQIFYPEDHSTITDLDLKNVFKKYHTCICMLKSCLEEIYEAPPSSLKSDSFLLVHLLNVLNKNDPEPLSIEDLAVAFNDQNFYTTMKAGIEQIVKLFTQYKLIYPAVQCHLQ